MQEKGRLQRRLGIPGATAIGVASMLGAGVFSGRSLGLARGIPIAGLVGCVLVAATTLWPALLGVAALLAVALAVRALVRRSRAA